MGFKNSLREALVKNTARVHRFGNKVGNVYIPQAVRAVKTGAQIARRYGKAAEGIAGSASKAVLAGSAAVGSAGMGFSGILPAVSAGKLAYDEGKKVVSGVKSIARDIKRGNYKKKEVFNPAVTSAGRGGMESQSNSGKMSADVLADLKKHSGS